MKKSDIEHVQRSLFLESGRKLKSQIDNIVQSINLKYPELANNIEFPQSLLTQTGNVKQNDDFNLLSKYLSLFLNRNVLA